MLITVSGLDGAGKSTLIRSLRATLDSQNRAVVVCHMNRDIGMYAAAHAARERIRTWLGGAATRRQAPQATNDDHLVCPPARRELWGRLRYAILWNKPCRRLVYLADVVIFLAFRLYNEGIRHRVLIMDRYFYDTLVDVAGPYSWGLIRALAWLTPVPHLAVLLDVSPELAFARKGERSLEELARRAIAYRRVFRWVPSPAILHHVELGRTPTVLQHLILAPGSAQVGPRPLMTTNPSPVRGMGTGPKEPR